MSVLTCLILFMFLVWLCDGILIPLAIIVLIQCSIPDDTDVPEKEPPPPIVVVQEIKEEPKEVEKIVVPPKKVTEENYYKTWELD